MYPTRLSHDLSQFMICHKLFGVFKIACRLLAARARLVGGTVSGRECTNGTPVHIIDGPLKGFALFGGLGCSRRGGAGGIQIPRWSKMGSGGGVELDNVGVWAQITTSHVHAPNVGGCAASGGPTVTPNTRLLGRGSIIMGSPGVWPQGERPRPTPPRTPNPHSCLIY